MRRACKSRLSLIEDNTHGLYSAGKNGQPLGSDGDLEIFSLPKSLTITDGGGYALHVTHPSDGPTLPRRAPKEIAVAGN
ncbi:MAG TPA: hypothetical protein EYQ71_05755 [Candidatus Thioglobus sp.]|nr:hypothetical protein [Candidatus Thioglobus sp.]